MQVLEIDSMILLSLVVAATTTNGIKRLRRFFLIQKIIAFKYLSAIDRIVCSAMQYY